MTTDNAIFLEERRQALEWARSLTEEQWVNISRAENTSVLMLKLSSSSIHRLWHKHQAEVRLAKA